MSQNDLLKQIGDKMPRLDSAGYANEITQEVARVRSLWIGLVIMMLQLAGCTKQQQVTPQQLHNALLDLQLEIETTRSDVRRMAMSFSRALSSGSIIFAISEFESIVQDGADAKKNCDWRIPSEFPSEARAAFLLASKYYKDAIACLQCAAADEISALNNVDFKKIVSAKKNLELASLLIRSAESEIARGTEIVQNTILQLSIHEQNKMPTPTTEPLR